MKKGSWNHLMPYVVGAAGGVLAMIVLPLTGIMDRAAQPGQGNIADWFGSLTSRQAVSLRSIGVEVPADLHAPERVQRAAGHYEMVCETCHGSPTQQQDQFALDLTPRPPNLMERMEQWRPPERLFWTVKHGIAGSAMPGWATQMREDEVWDMVAFITAMPSLAQQDYASLAGEADCTACHGDGGEGRLPGVPRLDIQSEDYLEASLKAFRDGTRQSGTMMTAARTLDDMSIERLAEQFGTRSEARVSASESLGAAIAASGIPERDIPACDSCHGESGRTEYPRLAGQDADYLANQLHLFKELGQDRGGPWAHIMAEVVRELSEEEIKALAEHYGR
jgi:cytochrome c553